jgi:hypothetical protein
VLKSAVHTMLIPMPKTASIGGQPLRDTELLAWCGEVIRSVLADLPRVLFRTASEQALTVLIAGVRRYRRRDYVSLLRRMDRPGDPIRPEKIPGNSPVDPG